MYLFEVFVGIMESNTEIISSLPQYFFLEKVFIKLIKPDDLLKENFLRLTYKSDTVYTYLNSLPTFLFCTALYLL